MYRKIIGLTMAAIGIPYVANAETYIFTATGTLSSFYTTDGNFKQIPNPVTSLHQGDAVQVSFTLATDGLVPGNLYDANPAINIYDAQVLNLTYKIGLFTSAAGFNETNYSSIQLWDDFPVSGIDKTDSFSINASRYIPGTASPVELGVGEVFVDFEFNAFDFSAGARQSDNINEEPPLSTYGSQSAFVGFLSTNNSVVTTASIENLHATLTAVPEPSTWTAMTLGFAFIGRGLRSKRYYRKRMSSE